MKFEQCEYSGKKFAILRVNTSLKLQFTSEFLLFLPSLFWSVSFCHFLWETVVCSQWSNTAAKKRCKGWNIWYIGGKRKQGNKQKCPYFSLAHFISLTQFLKIKNPRILGNNMQISNWRVVTRKRKECTECLLLHLAPKILPTDRTAGCFLLSVVLEKPLSGNGTWGLFQFLRMDLYKYLSNPRAH